MRYARDPRTMRAVAAAALAVLLALSAGAAHAQQAKPKAVAGSSVATPAGDTAAASRRCEYGIARALGGDLAAAENAFVAVLSAAPGDARALNNLGNLRVASGDLDVALAFYDRALERRPDAAGIVLNRATTLMMMGEIEAAEAEAARGVKLAGGEDRAAALLGLPAHRAPAERAGDKPFVSTQEIRALLDAATKRVPGDSMQSGAAADSTKAAPARKPARTWRSAGPRAGDTGDIVSVLYWMK